MFLKSIPWEDFKNFGIKHLSGSKFAKMSGPDQSEYPDSKYLMNFARFHFFFNIYWPKSWISKRLSVNLMRLDQESVFPRGSNPDPDQLRPGPKPWCKLIPRLFLTLLYPILCTNLQPVVSGIYKKSALLQNIRKYHKYLKEAVLAPRKRQMKASWNRILLVDKKKILGEAAKKLFL